MRYTLYDENDVLLGGADTMQRAADLAAEYMERQAKPWLDPRVHGGKRARAVRCNDSSPGEWPVTVYLKAPVGVLGTPYRNTADAQRAIRQHLREIDAL